MSTDRIKYRLLSWLEQCLMRRAPQDDPLSYSALSGALAAYAGMDMLQVRASSDWLVAVAMTGVDVLVMILFAWTLLRLTKKPARFVQTLTSLAGTGAVLGFVGLPLILQASHAHLESGPTPALVLGWLVLLAWSIAVQAHIFRHALSVRYGVGLLVAGCYVVLAVSLIEMFFPRVAGG